MNSLLSQKAARLLLLLSAVAAPVASAADSALTAAKCGVFKDPLHYTSPQEPDAAESAALDLLLTRLPSEANPRVQAGWIEDFIAARPDSGWTPSLCFQLGEYYRDHGRYSLALARWEAAFSALTNSYTPQANTARGYVVRSLARLYLQLGREDRIGLLLDASTAAPVNDDTITRDMTKLREDYGRTAAFRGKSPTCAAVALSKYAAALRPGDTSLEARILNSPGKQQSLSLLNIQQMATQLGLPGQVLRVTAGLPVPCIIHYSQQHFAAVVEKAGYRYRVADPVFQEPRWLVETDLHAEMSGLVVAPTNALPPGCSLALEQDARSALGRGYPNTIDDADDWWTGAGASFGSSSWDVSEPYISLWLELVASTYPMADGAEQRLRLLYSQRAGWMAHWTGFVDYSYEYDPENRVYTHTVNYAVVPKGGVHFYSNDGQPREQYEMGTLQFSSGHQYWYGNYKMLYPDGRWLWFSHQVQYALGYARAYLTSAYDRYGRPTGIYNETVGGVARVIKLRDYELRDTVLRYQNPNSTWLTEIVDPYGRTNRFEYDGSGRLLTNRFAPDQAASFAYDDKGVITNLSTAYGSTGFAYTSNTNSGNVVTRSMRVFLPAGGQHLYMYRDQSTKLNTNSVEDLIPFAYTNEVPSSAPFTNTFDNTWMDARNSFYWGPMAFDKLSAQFRGSGNFDDLTVADYKLAVLSHWLRELTPQLSQVLSMTRGPSPDGVLFGPKQWFDYRGKTPILETNQGQVSTNWYARSPNRLPGLAAHVLPDGSSSYTYAEYNTTLQPTSIVSTYGNPGSVLTRTNTYTYSVSGYQLRNHYGPSNTLVRANTWNSRNQLLSTTNALGETTSFTYSDSAPYLLTSIRQPNGLLTTNIYYTTSGQTNFLQRSETPALGITNSFTYTNCLVQTMTDARGVTVTNHYDSLRRPVDSMSPHGTNRIVYTNLLVAYTVNALNRTNRFGYDPYGRKIWEADPLNRTNWFQYCPCGSLSAVCNPLNQWTHFYYNNAGQLLSTLYPDSYWVSNRYDALGRLACTLDSAGATATNYYNSQGLVYAVSNVLGRVSAAVFDAWDRATSTIDSSGLGTTNQYDLLGRVVMGTAADGSWVGFAYSANTNGPVAATNQLGDVTRFVYDLAGRRIFETNAIGGVVRYSYGVSGELLSLTDANTNTTRWGYDVLGRMLYRTNATSNRVLGLNYDALGRVTNRWTPAKGNIGYTYDPLGNLTNIAYSTQPAVRMQYDPLNRLTNRVDLAGTHQFTYNSAGLLASEDGPWADDTILYTYTNRMPASAGLQGAWVGSWMQTYGYDHGLRLTNITSAAGPFGYNYQAGKPALLNRLSLPSGPYVDYGFDHMDRLTNQVCRAAGGAVIDAYGRLFNVASQPTRQTRNDGSYVDLAYDKLGQLTNAVGREAGGTFRSHEQLSYKYDPAGNLLYRTNNGFVQSFSVNARNELGTVTRSGTFTASGSTLPATTNLTVNSLSGTLYGDASYASAGHTLADGTNIFTAVALGVGLATTNRAETVLPATVSHTYDPNGNLTSDGLRGFEYDEDNQLVAITRTNQWRSEFIYDGTGRRRIRRELKWAVSTWLITNEVRYVYSGMLVIQERDISNMPLVSYTRGMDLSGTQQGAGGIGGLLARTDHTTITALFQTTFYLSDHSGNVATLVTTNGQRAAHYLYDPYGNLLAASGPLADANLYRASSKELHAYSGLVYFGKRYYSPALQRWINQDPISELGGLNLHVFAANTPAARYDGWGHQALSLKRLKELANNSHGFDSLFSHPSLEIVVSCGSTGFFSARSPASNSPKTGAANSSMGGTIPDAVRTIPVVGMVLAPVAQVIVGAAKTIGGLLTLSGNRISGGLMDMFGGIVGRNGVFGQGWLDLPGLLRPGGTVETYAAKLNAEALSEGLDYAVNDNKYGHANAASKAQSDLGIAGIPLVVAGNVYYEAQHAFMPGHNPGTDPTYHRSDFKFLGLADGQNPLSWVYDTPGDILAASFGQLTGLLLPLRNTSAVNKSVFLIPGPDYRGTDDWEQLCYPGAACPWR